jgi:hypothetical protein
MKRFVFGAVGIVAVLAIAAAAVSAIRSGTSVAPKGFSVEVLAAGGAKELGPVAYDIHFAERVLDVGELAPAADGRYRIRIQHGPEGMANLDAVELRGGGKPLALVTAVDAASGEDFLKKLGKRDFDVINVQGRTIELAFASAAKGGTLTLAIVGREEDPARLATSPCEYSSTLHPSSDGAPKFSYQLGSRRGALTLDGALTKEDELGAPIFANFTKPISGHPDGTTYGYVKNDDRNLYAAIDFTSDNTYDGEADYGAVVIDTPQGQKRFQVSVGKTAYGVPGFTYTDKVDYQHKVYELRIPLADLGVSAGSKEALQMKFMAYGTSACPPNVAISKGAQSPTGGDVYLRESPLTQAMLQINIANTGQTLNIGMIRIHAQGTGDDANDIQSVELYKDMNSDGQIDPGDPQPLASGTFSSDDGQVDLTVDADKEFPVLNGTKALIVYVLKPSTPNGATFSARFDAQFVGDPDIAVGASGLCLTANFSGAPFSGGEITIRPAGAATAAAGANNSAAGAAALGQTNVPMLQLAIAANAAEALDVNSVTITDATASAAAPLISAVRLWEDVDDSGTVTTGDVQLTQDKAFTAGTPTIDLVATTPSTIAAGTSKQYLITYDFAAAASASLSPFASAKRLASYLARGLLAPFTIAGCGGSGGSTASSSTTLSDAPTGAMFTDESGNAISTATPGTIVQVRTADGAKILEFTMGTSSVSLDGAALGRDAAGTLVALGSGSAMRLSLLGADKAVVGLPETITAFVPCDDNDNRVLICPAAGTVPDDPLACAGPVLLAPEAAASGGYTWSNVDRTGADDCRVAGAALLFSAFYGKGLTSYTFQAQVAAMADVTLTGSLSTYAMHPAGAPVSGGVKTLLAE